MGRTLGRINANSRSIVVANEEKIIEHNNSPNHKIASAKGGKNKKGSKHISTHIQEMLNDPNFELKLKDGSIIKGAPMKAIIKTAVAKAVSGDMRAFDILAKRGWGDKMDITTNGKDLPTPILGGISVQANDSNDQATEAN